MRPKQAALLRFLVVGAVMAAASAIGILLIVAATGWDPIVAAAIVAVVGNVIGFVANRQWSFLASHAHPLPQFLRYATVATVATLASIALFAFFTRTVGLHYLVASLAVSAVFAVTNFLAHFHWSFAPRRGPGRSA